MCSKTPLNPRLFTAVLPKRLYILLHIHHAFMIIFETSHTGLIMASLNVLGKLLPSSRTLSPFPLFLHWRSPLPFCVLFLFPASSISWATLAVSISFCNLDFIYRVPRVSRSVFSVLFPICLQYFLSHIHCFGCICFQFFPSVYYFSAAAPEISVLQGNLIPCRITGT